MKTLAVILLLLFPLTAQLAIGNEAGSGEVTFSETIAPILYTKCLSCHREGGGGPFVLQTYDDARRRAKTIVRVVESQYMPPWHATHGDVPLSGDRRLTEEQILAFRQWIDAGRPEGNPDRLPPLPEFPEGWALGEPDMILTMEEAYDLPADGDDIYRNFVIKTNLKEKRYLKAIEYRPSSPEVVHHALFYADTSGRSRQVDELDPEPGFKEMPVGEGTGRGLGAWVPGLHPLPLPQGLAQVLPAKSEIVIQIHFHLTGKTEREQSTIGLYFGDEPPERPFTSIQLPPAFGAFSGINLAPGESDQSIEDRFQLPIDVDAFGVRPHAHYRGKSLRLTAELKDGKKLVLLDIPEWDMDWQEEYRFEEIVTLPAGTTLLSEVAWDNSPDSPDNPVIPPVRVRWGFESYDEMGSIDLLLTPHGEGGKAADKKMKLLRQHYRDHLVWTAGNHLLKPDKLTVFGQLRQKAVARFDLDQDGVLSVTERQAAASALRSSR